MHDPIPTNDPIPDDLKDEIECPHCHAKMIAARDGIRSYETNLENSGQYHRVVLLSDHEQEIGELEAKVAVLKGTLPGRMMGAQTFADEKCRCFLLQVRTMINALQAVMALIEEGILVRDTSRDSEPNWAMEQIRIVRVLAMANDLLGKKDGADEGAPKTHNAAAQEASGYPQH